jgi:hypothetical protein
MDDSHVVAFDTFSMGMLSNLEASASKEFSNVIKYCVLNTDKRSSLLYLEKCNDSLTNSLLSDMSFVMTKAGHFIPYIQTFSLSVHFKHFVRML